MPSWKLLSVEGAETAARRLGAASERAARSSKKRADAERRLIETHTFRSSPHAKEVRRSEFNAADDRFMQDSGREWRARGEFRREAGRLRNMALGVGGAAGLGVGVAGGYAAGRGRKVKKMASLSEMGMVAKGLTGQPGDKRNTKYAASAFGGGQVGSVLGAGLGPPGMLIGGTLGAAGGAAAYGAYRNSNRSRVKRRRSIERAYQEKAEAARLKRQVRDVKNGVEKAWRGESGDKRNTKYLAAGYGGMATGAAIGRQIGARSQGMSVRQVKRGGRQAFQEAAERSLGAQGIGPETTMSVADGLRPTRDAFREGIAARQAAPGMSRTMRGNKIGALAGLVAGAGGYAAYRQSDRSKANRAAKVKGRLQRVG